MRPSQLLRKLAAYPRQNELAAALREVGRIERSLFMIEWTTNPDVRRRALVGLNKGEAHHALKRAINFHQRGELRDRTGEGQHYRVAGLNLRGPGGGGRRPQVCRPQPVATRSGQRGSQRTSRTGGTLEHAQQIAGHASPKTTKLYDRTADTVTVDEIERIVI